VVEGMPSQIIGICAVGVASRQGHKQGADLSPPRGNDIADLV